MVKNALDHVELLRGDDRVYFDGMPVGLVATAGGWQAAVATLQALRTVTHALRGWPTPLGVAINSADPIWDTSGQLADTDQGIAVGNQLDLLATQVLAFAQTSKVSA